MSSPALGTQWTLNKCGLKGGRDTAPVLFVHVVESPRVLLSEILQVVDFEMAFQGPGKYGDVGTEWGVDLTARQLLETDGDRCLMGFRMRELPRLFPDHLPLDSLPFSRPTASLSLPCPTFTHSLFFSCAGREKGNKPFPFCWEVLTDEEPEAKSAAKFVSMIAWSLWGCTQMD